MKINYRNQNFKDETLSLIGKAEKIVTNYEDRGHKLTLRQLYYQLVTKKVIPNEEKAYKRLGNILSKARLGGLIDWNSIEDRTRSLKGVATWESPKQILESAAYGYRNNKWVDQDTYIEVWVEKEALSGVINTACGPLETDYFACKGYVSQSAMWRAARRLLDRENINERVIILYLGDHDPSGIDMVRDIAERLEEFDCPHTEVHKIALDMAQIKGLNLPPDPAKVTDTRFKKYSEKYGSHSWELDALDPDYLVDLISDNILLYRDMDSWKAWDDIQKSDRAKMIKFASTFKG